MTFHEFGKGKLICRVVDLCNNFIFYKVFKIKLDG